MSGFRGGDTSQCQYAMLGFWAAERSGIKVPPAVWDRGAGVVFENADGRRGLFLSPARAAGSGHHRDPYDDRRGRGGVADGPNAPVSQCRRPERAEAAKAEPRRNSACWNPSIWTRWKSRTARKPRIPTTTNPRSAAACCWRGPTGPPVGSPAGTAITPSQWNMYYLYTFERMAALLNAQTIGGHDWYREGAAYLIKNQAKNGSWNTTIRGHCLHVVRHFVSDQGHRQDPAPRRAARSVGHGAAWPAAAGCPTISTRRSSKMAKSRATKTSARLMNCSPNWKKWKAWTWRPRRRPSWRKCSLGDREELIKQKDRLVKLAKNPNVEVRRTAIWALGPHGGFAAGQAAHRGLGRQQRGCDGRGPQRPVHLEPQALGLPSARNSLRESSRLGRSKSRRRCRGGNAQRELGRWYYKYRPYSERDDLSEALFQANIASCRKFEHEIRNPKQIQNLKSNVPTTTAFLKWNVSELEFSNLDSISDLSPLSDFILPFAKV